MDDKVRKHADDLYDQSMHELGQTAREEQRAYQADMARRKGADLPIGGSEIGALIVLKANHIERCMDRRLESYLKAFATIGAEPSINDLNAILEAVRNVQEQQIKSTAFAVNNFLKTRGAEGDATGSLTERSAHGYDRVLQRWKSWRAQVRLKPLNAITKTFLDPYPATLKGVEDDLDYWAGRQHEGAPGSEFDQKVRNRLEHLRHLYERFSRQMPPNSINQVSQSLQGMNVEMSEKAQKVFVSYSWDGEEHKKWVLAFVNTLRGYGIDAFNDETNLQLGARSPEFMERSVRESGRVLVICTENYKQKFDARRGGVGFEGHIISSEIVNEVGKNKFIPVLRSGDWKTALPTALDGLYGVDLRSDSDNEFRKLVKALHGVPQITPIGTPPDWLHDIAEPSHQATRGDNAKEYWAQRKGLPDTEIMKKIWSQPRWQIWIRPTQFRRARFQNLERCREFMISSYVVIRGSYPYPYFSADSFESGHEWIAGETDRTDGLMTRTERWALFRSGQFVHNRAFDKIQSYGDRVHVLQILDTVTAAFEFAGRMAELGLMSPRASITFEFFGVDGLQLTWPKDIWGDQDAVGRDCWCQDENATISREMPDQELRTKRRELALGAALEIYSKFGWMDPPTLPLVEAQSSRIG